MQQERADSAASSMGLAAVLAGSLAWRIGVLLTSDEVYRGAKWVASAILWLADPKFLLSGNQGPMRVYLPAIPLALTGDPASTRWFMMLLGTAALVPFYYLCRRCFDRRTALAATALLGFLPAHVNYGVISEAMVPYTLFLFTALWAATALVQGDRTRLGAALLLLSMALGEAVRFEMALLALPAFALLWTGRRRGAAAWVAFSAALFPAAWLLAGWAQTGDLLEPLRVSHQMGASQYHGYFMQTAREIGRATTEGVFALNDPDSTRQRILLFPILLVRQVSPVVLLFALAGLALWRRARLPLILGATALLTLLALGAGSLRMTVTAQERYLIPVSAMLLPFAAHAAGAIQDRISGRRRVPLVAVLAAACCLYYAATGYPQRPRLSAEVSQTVSHIRESIPEAEPLLCMDLANKNVFEYHAGFDRRILGPSQESVDAFKRTGAVFAPEAVSLIREHRIRRLLIHSFYGFDRSESQMEDLGLRPRLLFSSTGGDFRIYGITAAGPDSEGD